MSPSKSNAPNPRRRLLLTLSVATPAPQHLLLGLADDGARSLDERQRLASVAIGEATRVADQAAHR